MRDTLYNIPPFGSLNFIGEGNRDGLRIEIGLSITAARDVGAMNELVEVKRKL